MAANVAVGAVTNLLWMYFSMQHYRRLQQLWAAISELIGMWVAMAMSLGLLDFPPIADALDVHALWHAAMVAPMVWRYQFLVGDAKKDMEYDG
ncbi:Per1-like protein [Kalaharituber pfeilii]|nr:Per1-like protein [Kalaharituber pfeilii]